MKEHRKYLVDLLEKYIDGQIPPKKFLSLCPSGCDDDLVNSIFNIFCEPLSDWTKDKTWNDVANLCIKAIKENWTEEKLFDTLDDF